MNRYGRMARSSECRAFTRRDLIAVIAVAAILVVCLALPWFGRSRARAQSICCNCNLKQIGLSFRQWALDCGDQYPMRVSITNGGAMEWAQQGIAWPIFQVVSNELNTPVILVCPADKNRTNAPSFSRNLNNWELSYFVGLDADETQPQMILAGDSDLEINNQQVPSGITALGTNQPVGWSAKRRHKLQGNVALSDGSVQGYSNTRFRDALRHTGDLTNRVLIP